MYDRPNARKGMYLKIRNILISVAAPVNHKVLYPWISFNIIYIMRTKIRIRGIWGFNLYHHASVLSVQIQSTW